MKWRIGVIFIILFFRFSLGWIESNQFPNNYRIKVTGNIDKILRNESNCIIVVERFWLDYRNPCYFSQFDHVEVVGKVNSGVIDRFLGRLWLTNAELLVLPSDSKHGHFFDIIIAPINVMREKIVNVYRMFLPEPESGLIAGIILGYKKDIGQEMYQLMVKSGTIHIAVASGYNIMLVGGTVLAVCFWFLKRKQASMLAVFVMLLYAIEAGGEPPVIRAVIMGGVVFGSWIVGRKVISWWILLVAGWLMVLVEPLLLVDVSFQLSMGASVGLMIVEPWISKLLSKNHERLVETLGGSGILTSLSTMIITAPIIWWHFGRMSMIGVVSNILILPLVPILMIVGSFMQLLPGIFLYPTYVIAHWMVEVIRFFGG